MTALVPPLVPPLYALIAFPFSYLGWRGLVLLNLLSNAVKFTPEGGQIDVQLQRVEGRAQLMVRDTGIGIVSEFLPHVFERFRQADSSTGRRFGGLGLGLAIVKQIVELHGGSIRLASAPGRGATFTLNIPVGTAVVTKMRSPQTTGEETPAPASGAFQARFFWRLHCTGNPLSEETP